MSSGEAQPAVSDRQRLSVERFSRFPRVDYHKSRDAVGCELLREVGKEYSSFRIGHYHARKTTSFAPQALWNYAVDLTQYASWLGLECEALPTAYNTGHRVPIKDAERECAVIGEVQEPHWSLELPKYDSDKPDGGQFYFYVPRTYTIVIELYRLTNGGTTVRLCKDWCFGERGFVARMNWAINGNKLRAARQADVEGLLARFLSHFQSVESNY